MLARLLVLAAIGFPLGSAAASPPLGLPADFRLEATGPDGGTVWTGRIPNYFMSDPRLSDVYLPPGYNPGERYPVLYLLHGFWGSPGSLVHGLHFADAADEQITSGAASPFIAVMAPGGPMTKTTSDEWAGVGRTMSSTRSFRGWTSIFRPIQRGARSAAFRPAASAPSTSACVTWACSGRSNRGVVTSSRSA